MSRQRASGSGSVGGIGLVGAGEEDMNGAAIDSSMELSLMPLHDNQGNQPTMEGSVLVSEPSIIERNYVSILESTGEHQQVPTNNTSDCIIENYQ